MKFISVVFQPTVLLVLGFFLAMLGAFTLWQTVDEATRQVPFNLPSYTKRSRRISFLFSTGAILVIIGLIIMGVGVGFN